MTNKKYQRQSKSKSLGQTLTGILIGLILGAIVIAVLLWFLNQQRMPTEPQRSASGSSEVEIMVPNQAVLPDSVSDTMASAVTVIENSVEDWVEMPNEEALLADEDAGETPVPVVKPTTNPSASLAEKKPNTQRNETAPVRKTDPVEPKVVDKKPSAAEILEHGSVEKARTATDTPKNTPKAASSEKRVKVQAGAYSQAQQAEAQRAKLALLGISAHIETGQVNGKTVHRVRTETLSGDKAASVRQKLQNQGIDAITIGGQ